VPHLHLAYTCLLALVKPLHTCSFPQPAPCLPAPSAACPHKAVAEYCRDKANWAKLTKRKAATGMNGASEATAGGVTITTAGGGHSAETTTAIVVGPQRFIIPVPGRDGAPHGSLAGQTVVLTGTFPELGGGAGLNLGKDRAKAMVEAFGGKVTGSVSGRTTLLVVGKVGALAGFCLTVQFSVSAVPHARLAMGNSFRSRLHHAT
jgi:hypothetical protein